ncbi:MAG TPA: hypothetical protein VIY29_26050 [Ktedonobacteraceae bacterium]
MNEATQWRFALAQQLAKSYAANPKARVIMVAGSTGRGSADRYSDLEIDVYWSAPPTDAERKAAVEGSGAELLSLYAYEEDEWAEDISIGDFHIGTSTFLVETMEQYLTQVLDEHSTAPLPLMRLYSLQHAMPLVGAELVERWRTRAAAYPTALAHAMLREHLVFEGFGYAEEMLAARDDMLALADIFCRVERQILGALLGLNRLYLPNPTYKGMDELIAEMRLSPPDLSARLKHTFRLPSLEGVHLLHSVIEDLFALIETYMPEFDTQPYRESIRQRRGVWDQPLTT